MSDETANPSSISLPLEGVHVLLVEDTDDSRDAATLLLEAHGATVTAVASAREALAMLDQATPDVLVSDIGMPDEDGYELIRRVRLRPSELGGKIPAIALTAFTEPRDREAALEAGFEAHICKPVEPDDLVTIIKGLTGRC